MLRLHGLTASSGFLLSLMSLLLTFAGLSGEQDLGSCVSFISYSVTRYRIHPTRSILVAKSLFHTLVS